MQWNMTSTIRKKLVNIQGLPYMPLKLVNLGPEKAENGGTSPKFSYWETLPALPYG